jgi:hypothetical protein
MSLIYSLSIPSIFALIQTQIGPTNWKIPLCVSIEMEESEEAAARISPNSCGAQAMEFTTSNN